MVRRWRNQRGLRVLKLSPLWSVRAAVHESAYGTARHFAAMQWHVGFRGQADFSRAICPVAFLRVAVVGSARYAPPSRLAACERRNLR